MRTLEKVPLEYDPKASGKVIMSNVIAETGGFSYAAPPRKARAA